MNLAGIFKIVLTLAALVAVPVASWTAGHPVIYSVMEFVASLLALFLRSPLAPEQPKLGNPDVRL